MVRTASLMSYSTVHVTLHQLGNLHSYQIGSGISSCLQLSTVVFELQTLRSLLIFHLTAVSLLHQIASAPTNHALPAKLLIVRQESLLSFCPCPCLENSCPASPTSGWLQLRGSIQLSARTRLTSMKALSL